MTGVRIAYAGICNAYITRNVLKRLRAATGRSRLKLADVDDELVQSPIRSKVNIPRGISLAGELDETWLTSLRTFNRRRQRNQYFASGDHLAETSLGYSTVHQRPLTYGLSFHVEFDFELLSILLTRSH